MKPTARQLEVHAFMLRYREEHSMWPTVREIADAIGVKSTNGVFETLRALQKKGYARQRVKLARGWIAIEGDRKQSPVPVLTADTITDEQIRDLWRDGAIESHERDLAIRTYRGDAGATWRTEMRARCADLINGTQRGSK